MEILFLLSLIVVNGLFAMSEIALVTAKRSRLAKLAEDGDKSAAVAIKLGQEPTRFLSTIQIGITSIGILNGIVGEGALAGPLAVRFQAFGMDPEISHIISTAIVVLSITYITIVVGELVPKRLGQFDPEGIACLVSRPMFTLSTITRPFGRLLSASTDAILRLMGQSPQAYPSVTEEEIHAMLEEGSEAGVIEQHEHEMVRNVFRLDDRQLGTLMVPRADIVFLDVSKPLEENILRVTESEHSRFPVCNGGLQSLLGVVNAKQLLSKTLKGGLTEFTSQLQPCVYVPETLTGMELLDHFRTSGTQMVFVVDEYGEIQGLVTLQDMLEAVTGEFVPRNSEDSWAVERQDGSWLLDGLIPVPELKDTLELRSVPDEDKGLYHTLSGLMMWQLGRMPQTGDVMIWEEWTLEIVDLDGQRIDKVLASKRPEEVIPENGRSEVPSAEAKSDPLHKN
ncbi:HlyC/CorC family transporter [Chlorobium sp. BLA1]|uniref:hemolysin family protein n=1 Tax=Candidatus Chlorobium masyuteum TaxID=2716876 RepID=UPI00142433F8|nr:hemolysin family protein [Candidatus Chlorobium masyuteum]NHQ59685.1 HlyC/CorC family transporter [Candidatus Chlorobium masyuteum]NTU45030.1 HlyC/CorC family transporter [Chlorobiaceae bacterium]